MEFVLVVLESDEVQRYLAARGRYTWVANGFETPDTMVRSTGSRVSTVQPAGKETRRHPGFAPHRMDSSAFSSHDAP